MLNRRELNRREFLQLATAISASLALPKSTLAQSFTYIPFAPYQTTYQPLFKVALADNREVCPVNLGYFYPHLRNFWAPMIMKPGRAADCNVPVSTWDNAQGFSRSGNPVLLTPKNLILPGNMVSTGQSVPHNPDIAWETWKAYSDQPNIDPNTTRMNILGEWGLTVDEAYTSSINHPGQVPDSPVDWQQWRQMEVANELGTINDEDPQNHLILELNPREDLLYLFPDDQIGFPKTLAQHCPVVADVPTYRVELLTVFPVIDMTGPVVKAEMWADIRHIDPVVTENCIDPEAYRFIKRGSLLAGVPLPALREANIRVDRTTRIWPIQGMELQPIGGGISQETLGNVAMIICGALVIVAIVALIASQPQFILVAAVAI